MCHQATHLLGVMPAVDKLRHDVAPSHIWQHFPLLHNGVSHHPPENQRIFLYDAFMRRQQSAFIHHCFHKRALPVLTFQGQQLQLQPPSRIRCYSTLFCSFERLTSLITSYLIAHGQRLLLPSGCSVAVGGACAFAVSPCSARPD
jgi:hypothetical protein